MANILIVDDSVLTRTAIKKVLDMLDIEVDSVFEAGNGLEALEVLQANDIELVLADLNMPQMNGFELIQKMQENKSFSNIPVVVISTESSHSRINDLEDVGIRGYLHKPFQPEDFRSILIKNLGVCNGSD